MEAGRPEHVAFYLTGRRLGAGLAAVDEFELRPALLAGYRDLARLRYDFPLVLVDDSPADRTCVQSLSGIVDGVVHEIAQGDDGDRLTQHALRLEQKIRSAVAAGASGSLSALWTKAADQLAAHGDDRLKDSLQRARAALKVDGEVVDCGKAMPARLLRHTWTAVQEAKADRVRDDIGKLIIKLSDILRVDFAYSKAGRSADSLKAAFGTAHAEVFDFEAMSRLLSKSSSVTALPVGRRRRIEQLLAALKSQRFFRAPRGTAAAAGGAQPYSFVFDDCASALASACPRPSNWPKRSRLLNLRSTRNTAKPGTMRCSRNLARTASTRGIWRGFRTTWCASARRDCREPKATRSWKFCPRVCR
jgi:hypothetical protein